MPALLANPPAIKKSPYQSNEPARHPRRREFVKGGLSVGFRKKAKFG